MCAICLQQKKVRLYITVFFLYRNLLLMHKIIYSRLHEYLHECLELCKSRRTKNLVVPANKNLTASSIRIFFVFLWSNFDYLTFDCSRCSISRMLFVKAILLWNKLPNHMKLPSNYSTFKHLIEKLYIPTYVFVSFLLFSFLSNLHFICNSCIFFYFIFIFIFFYIFLY